jgi:hypothetical protein
VLGERRACSRHDGTPGWETPDEIVGGHEGASLVLRLQHGGQSRRLSRVGVADETLYVHFADRVELFLALLRQSLPPMTGPRSLQSVEGGAPD